MADLIYVSLGGNWWKGGIQEEGKRHRPKDDDERC